LLTHLTASESRVKVIHQQSFWKHIHIGDLICSVQSSVKP